MSKVEYRLKSAKLRKLKDKQVLDVEFDEVTTTEGGEIIITPVTRGGAKPVHPDLLDSLKAIVPHFLILTEMRAPKDFKSSYFEKEEFVKDKTLSDFAVTGVHMKEKSETRQVIILGRKILKSGKVISMVAPLQSLSDESEKGYIHAEILEEAIDAFLDAAEQYLGGKYEPNPQGEIPYSKPEEQASGDPQSGEETITK